MARKTLLEKWQEQNSVRDGPPSQLLKQMRAIAEDVKKFSESPTARQIREGLQRFQESKVAERLMGRMRPVAVPTKQEPVKQEKKREPKHPDGRLGRRSDIPVKQRTRAFSVLNAKPKMYPQAARKVLREAGITGHDSSLNRLIEKVYKSRP